MKNLFKEEVDFKEFEETMDQKSKSQSSSRKESDNEGSEVVFQCIKEVSETEEVIIPLFCGDDYVDWRETMKTYLKAMGSKVWRVVAKKKSKQFSKEDYHNNSIALKVIKKGLTNDVKKNVGHHTSTKFLWIKLEEAYKEKHDSSKKEVKSNKGVSLKCSKGNEERLESQEKNHISREETIEIKEEKGSEGSLDTSSEENNFINDLMIRSKASEGISEDKENKKDDSSQCS